MSTKISALPAAASAVATDQLAVVQGGVTKRETLTQQFALLQSTAGLAFTGPISFGPLGVDALGKVTGPNSNWLINTDGTVNFSGGNITSDAAGQLQLPNITLLANGSAVFANGDFQIKSSGGNTVVPLFTLTPTAGTSYTVNADKPYQAITTNSQIDFTATSNRPSASFVESVVIRVNTSASIRALTFNASWVFLGAGAPSSLPANKVGILSLTIFGANETDVVAAWGVQP